MSISVPSTPETVVQKVSLAEGLRICAADPLMRHLSILDPSQVSKAQLQELRIVLIRDHGLNLDEKKKDAIETSSAAEQTVAENIAAVRKDLESGPQGNQKHPYGHLMGI